MASSSFADLRPTMSSFSKSLVGDLELLFVVFLRSSLLRLCSHYLLGVAQIGLSLIPH